MADEELLTPELQASHEAVDESCALQYAQPEPCHFVHSSSSINDPTAACPTAHSAGSPSHARRLCRDRMARSSQKFAPRRSTKLTNPWSALLQPRAAAPRTASLHGTKWQPREHRDHH